jgi:hypothetical protein
VSGDNGGGPSTDILGSFGIPYPDVPPDVPDPEMDARVRAVAQRVRPPSPVTVRHLETPPSPVPAVEFEAVEPATGEPETPAHVPRSG